MAERPILTEQLSKGFRRLFKRSSRRVSKASRRRIRQSPVAGKSATVRLKADPPKSPKPLDLKSPPADNLRKVVPQRRTLARLGQFWSNLFLVRPWLLVCGLWLVSVLMIAIALAGLSSPGREIVLEPVNSGMQGPPLTAPDTAAASRLMPRDESQQLTRRDPAATTSGAAGQAMPAWPVLVMVVACAGGCILVSRPGLMAEDSRRSRRRVPVSGGARPASPVVPPRRGRKHRRQKRSDSQVMVFRTGQKRKATSARATVMPSETWGAASNGAVNTGAQSVTVVPDGETSPLDWKDGSLAHKLDVRQTRSINSFL